MGMDIYSKTGVVFTVEEIASALFGGIKDVSGIVSAVRDITSWGSVESGLQERLSSVKTGGDLVGWISSLADSCVKDEYLDETVIGEAWDAAVEEAGLSRKLPLASFDYWTHSRISGYDVPMEVPCLVFNDHDLFEVKTTKAGKKLSKLLGQDIKQTTWTIMSV